MKKVTLICGNNFEKQKFPYKGEKNNEQKNKLNKKRYDQTDC